MAQLKVLFYVTCEYFSTPEQAAKKKKLSIEIAPESTPFGMTARASHNPEAVAIVPPPAVLVVSCLHPSED